MRHATCKALLVLLAGFALYNSQAQQQSTSPGQEQAEATPQAQEEEAAVPQPKAKPGEQPSKVRQQPRRSVQQDIQRVTPIPQAGSPSYGPVLTPGARPNPLPQAGLPGSTALPGSAQINNCTGNVCTDTSGNTYNQGAGNAAVNSEGRLCNRVGNTMQCF